MSIYCPTDYSDGSSHAQLAVLPDLHKLENANKKMGVIKEN